MNHSTSVFKYLHMKLNLILFLALLFFGYSEIYAQKVKVFGKIVDKESGEDLIGAYIVLKIGEEQKGGTSTDIDGTYSLEIDPGQYDITVSYVSYNDLDTISYSVEVYVISKNNKKDYLDCKEVYNEIKEDIIDLSESMGIYINNISQAGYIYQSL